MTKQLNSIAIYSCRHVITFRYGCKGTTINHNTVMFLKKASESLAHSGAVAIGHLKVMIEFEDGGALFASVTRFEQEPVLKVNYNSDGIFKEIIITVNLSVIGCSEGAGKKILNDSMNKYFSEFMGDEPSGIVDAT